MLEYKSLSWAPQVSDEGEFEGWLTKYGELDLKGDIVEKGAFDKALQRQKEFPLLWHHKLDEPIGIAYLEPVPEGVKVRGKIAIETTRGRDAYILAKQEILKGISYGYFAVNTSYKNGIRYLKEIDIFEVSLVSVPAQPKAQIIEVKHVLHNDDLPLADSDRSWNASEARKRIAKWASSDGSGDKDKIDWDKYKRAFLYVVKGKEENITGYKFPIADVIDGRLYAIPRAIYNAVVRLAVAKIPEEDKEGIRRVLAKYYEKMGKTPPWEKEEKMLDVEGYIHEILDWQEELEKVPKEVLLELKSAIDSLLESPTETKEDKKEEGEVKSLLSLLETIQILKKEVKRDGKKEG